jgi:hypothetical protein
MDGNNIEFGRIPARNAAEAWSQEQVTGYIKQALGYLITQSNTIDAQYANWNTTDRESLEFKQVVKEYQENLRAIFAQNSIDNADLDIHGQLDYLCPELMSLRSTQFQNSPGVASLFSNHMKAFKQANYFKQQEHADFFRTTAGNIKKSNLVSVCKNIRDLGGAQIPSDNMDAALEKLRPIMERDMPEKSGNLGNNKIALELLQQIEDVEQFSAWIVDFKELGYNLNLTQSRNVSRSSIQEQNW